MSDTLSNRIAPNNFDAGLDVSATRIQADLVALANRDNAPVPADIARRWFEAHMTAGFIPNAFPIAAYDALLGEQFVTQALPWMGAYNSLADCADPKPAETDIINPWRQKGIAQPAISPSSQLNLGDILSWEFSWAQTKPFLLDVLTLALATDAFYENLFTWGADCPTGKVPGQPVDNVVLQVLVDSALASENRIATTAPLLIRNFKANIFEITQVAYQSTANTMSPVSYGGEVPRGLCIQVFPRQPIPENARVRMIVSVPIYEATVVGSPNDVSGFGQTPWQKSVLSAHVTTLQAVR